ncbi:hypothetical protein CPLU01_05095 [Colletotrichum plurivorum]|uniref:Uncharacterized protein n=1 Tax=Colletotrichum plurivorum TaxID=2175906 RepID=A0A8H6KMA5_9PEZI|nr:hypothetical protein CPLU01_05095 [Colletotrichum plurivorum]
MMAHPISSHDCRAGSPADDVLPLALPLPFLRAFLVSLHLSQVSPVQFLLSPEFQSIPPRLNNLQATSLHQKRIPLPLDVRGGKWCPSLEVPQIHDACPAALSLVSRGPSGGPNSVYDSCQVGRRDSFCHLLSRQLPPGEESPEVVLARSGLRALQCSPIAATVHLDWQAGSSRT